VLRLQPRPNDASQHTPADYFFTALAEAAQNRAIGVVLSGTAADGAVGIREIKAVGGITLAQEPGTAKFDGMPRAAVATGAVDLVLPPNEIALELARISRHPFIRPPSPRSEGDNFPIIEDQLPRIFTLLRNASGVDFTHYKLPTIRRRLQRRMVLHRITSIDHYVRYLQKNPDEVNALYRDLLIHVTRFFREPESFKALAETVFPAILAARQGNEDPVRIWVPGCATGEEPYSIAIALLEALGENAGATPIQIFATDVSEIAIEHARTGTYPDSISADVSAERLRRFFVRVDGSYRISKAVRDVCVFARQDLTRDPPFSRLDLIVCRNVLIYLAVTLQKRLMAVFHYALKPTGYLMLGAAETAGPMAELFSLADKRHRLYSKKSAAVRADMNFAPLDARLAEEPRVRAPVLRTGTVQNEANRIILDRFSPPAVLVNQEQQIIYFRGQTGAFLEPAPGEATLNVLKMAREGLLHGLRSALAEAQQRGEPVRREGLHVKQNGHGLEMALEVIPVEGPLEGRHFLILFEEARDRQARQRPAQHRRGARGRQLTLHEQARVAQLEQELAASREYLQSIIQDLEAANEELQSANEEILSSNEELQSTNEELDTAKEELQSTNEELNTVNEELHNRNEELSRSNSDLVNLLGSVQIAIVMVTNDLRIRRFTPMAERILNLIPGDVGRRISDINPNIDCPDLEKLIAESIDGVVTVEREVRDRQGAVYALRIRPYKSIENRIDGAVLALFDIDAARSSERMADYGARISAAIMEHMHEPLALLDRDLRVLSVNAAFERGFAAEGTGRTVGLPLQQLDGGRRNFAELSKLLQNAWSAQMPIEELVLPAADGADGIDGTRRLRVSSHLLPGLGGRPIAMLLHLQEDDDGSPPPAGPR
jgi:two-component system CheB/CheR fusion protein